jgi:hypothetical protein
MHMAEGGGCTGGGGGMHVHPVHPPWVRHWRTAHEIFLSPRWAATGSGIKLSREGGRKKAGYAKWKKSKC